MDWHCRDPYAICRTFLSFPLTKEQVEKNLFDKNRYAFQVVESTTQIIIGYGEIYLTDKSAHLGRILIGKEKYRGKGYGNKIVNYLLEYAFKNLNQSRVELNVFDWNTVAINCYKRVGFVFNPEKNSVRQINGKTWLALNMVLERKNRERSGGIERNWIPFIHNV